MSLNDSPIGSQFTLFESLLELRDGISSKTNLKVIPIRISPLEVDTFLQKGGVTTLFNGNIDGKRDVTTVKANFKVPVIALYNKKKFREGLDLSRGRLVEIYEMEKKILCEGNVESHSRVSGINGIVTDVYSQITGIDINSLERAFGGSSTYTPLELTTKLIEEGHFDIVFSTLPVYLRRQRLMTKGVGVATYEGINYEERDYKLVSRVVSYKYYDDKVLRGSKELVEKLSKSEGFLKSLEKRGFRISPRVKEETKDSKNSKLEQRRQKKTKEFYTIMDEEDSDFDLPMEETIQKYRLSEK